MSQGSAFRCCLDGQPDHLTPSHQIDWCWRDDMTGGALFLNPDCQLRSSGDLPTGLSLDPQFVESFAPMEDMAWVHNSEMQAWQPFWLGHGAKAALAKAERGGLPSLPPHYRHALTMAGVVTGPEQHAVQHDSLATRMSRCADQFQRNGYAPFRGMIHPFHISAMRRYYRNLVRTG